MCKLDVLNLGTLRKKRLTENYKVNANKRSIVFFSNSRFIHEGLNTQSQLQTFIPGELIKYLDLNGEVTKLDTLVDKNNAKKKIYYSSVLIINNGSAIKSNEEARKNLSFLRTLVVEDNAVFVLLTESTLYDVVSENLIVSGFPVQHNLIVPSCLPENPADNDIFSLEQCWLGSSWISPLLEDEPSNEDSPYKVVFPPILYAEIPDRLRKLAERSCKRRLGTDDKKVVGERLDLYTLFLEACVPMHNNKKGGTLITSHFYPWSGPFQISGLGPLDPVILDLKNENNKQLSKGTQSAIRELIFEGWLTIFQSDENLWVHPGSLALLYWVAHQKKMKFANTPDDFLKRYQFWKKANWFGGKIDQTQWD